ncbi:hypothetical protein BBK14_24390 [Parafrankia soli]|uniref:Uncharacterized protein n=1 Tax=Parafrankia soli TaxID=2599596 RepID=A0A1S1PTH8_9ACTN|nr:hypothetical protein [Parafrankia soli]OHV23264.1 hypothetical protein BBK14_24390 [Parafrankia soli]
MSAAAGTVPARNASEAIRQINHRTFGPARTPAELGSTVVALAEMAARLVQACEQLGRQADEMALRPGLYDDRGQSAQRTARQAAEWLRRSSERTEALADALTTAAVDLSHLGVNR